MDMQKTGNLISEKRKELGLTQKELGERLHVTVSAVSKWERGLSFPDITLLEDISTLLELSVEEILEGEKTIGVQQDTHSLQTQKVLDVAKTQISGNKKKSKKIIYSILIALMIVVIAFLCVIICFSTIDYDSTSWKDQFEITAHNGSKLTIPLRAKVGMGGSYFGDSKIVIKKNKIGNCYDVAKYLNEKFPKEVKISSSGLPYQIERCLEDGTKEYFAIFQDAEKQWIYFVAQEIKLNQSRVDVDEYIFFPLVIVNDALLYGVDLGLEYRINNNFYSIYEQNAIEQIINEFQDFYDGLANYSYTCSGANIIITDELQNISINVQFYEISGHLLYKITKI